MVSELFCINIACGSLLPCQRCIAKRRTTAHAACSVVLRAWVCMVMIWAGQRFCPSLASMACDPDVIFIGGRLASVYDDLSQIAPVVFLSTDTEKGVVKSVRDNATAIASLFVLEDKVDGLMDDFDARIEALAKAANGSTALVTLFTSGSVNVLGTDGRCSLISNEIGFTNIAADEVTATHGNEVSFETIVEKDPEYIFVLNRDAAIGSDGADQAQKVVENDLTRQTQAYRNGHIVYLSNPAVWYTVEGGIEALNIMLEDLEGVLL